MNVKNVVKHINEQREKDIKSVNIRVEDVIQLNEVIEITKHKELETLLILSKLFMIKVPNKQYLYISFSQNKKYNKLSYFDYYSMSVLNQDAINNRKVISMQEFVNRIETHSKLQKLIDKINKEKQAAQELPIDIVLRYNLTASLADLCYQLIYEIQEDLDKKNLMFNGTGKYRYKNLQYIGTKFRQALLDYQNTWFQHTKLPEEDTSDIITHVSDIVVYFTKKLINCICYSKSNIEKLEAFINSLEQAKIYKRVDRPDDMNLFEQELFDLIQEKLKKQ